LDRKPSRPSSGTVGGDVIARKIIVTGIKKAESGARVLIIVRRLSPKQKVLCHARFLFGT